MKPIDLYRFVMGPDVWTFTSADTDQTYDAGSGAELYAAITVGRGEIQVKTDITKNDLEVRIPIDHALAVFLLTSFTEQKMSVTVFTNIDGSVETSWKGRLAGIVPTDAQLKLNCESIFTSLRRPGLRARFQKSCRHALYGRGCKLNPEDFAVAGTVTGITGDTVTVAEAASQPDQYYFGGMLRDPSGTLAYIINHTGSALTLQYIPYTLRDAFGVGPAAVSIYPGCDHSRGTCWSKFNNGLNYGGFDWIPDKNPMGGSSIV